MTTEEQKNIIGGVVLEYSQGKQRLAALQQDIKDTLADARQAEEVIRFNRLAILTRMKR